MAKESARLIQCLTKAEILMRAATPIGGKMSAVLRGRRLCALEEQRI